LSLDTKDLARKRMCGSRQCRHARPSGGRRSTMAREVTTASRLQQHQCSDTNKVSFFTTHLPYLQCCLSRVKQSNKRKKRIRNEQFMVEKPFVSHDSTFIIPGRTRAKTRHPGIPAVCLRDCEDEERLYYEYTISSTRKCRSHSRLPFLYDETNSPTAHTLPQLIRLKRSIDDFISND
jgi:hypothetical protein